MHGLGNDFVVLDRITSYNVCYTKLLRIIGLVLVRNDEPVQARADDFCHMGTASRIHKVVKVEDKLQIFVEGLQRFRIDEWVSRERPFVVRAQYFPETSYKEVTELKAYTVAVINTIKELLPLNPLYGEELKLFVITSYSIHYTKLYDALDVCR